MTKQEFTELTGINPTEEEFDKIHELYMATGAEMDKQSFCAAYKSCKDMTLVNALYHSLAFSIDRLKEERDRIEKEREEINNIFEDLHERALAAADVILSVANKNEDKKIYYYLNEAALTLIGEYNVWMRKLIRGYNMTCDERESFFNEIAELKGQVEEYKYSGKIEKYDREKEKQIILWQRKEDVTSRGKTV